MHTAHVLLTLAALFSAVPGDKRAREVRRFVDVWRVRVDRKAVERAQQWGSLAGGGAKASDAASVTASVAMGGASAGLLSAEEAMKVLATNLAKEDAFLAAAYEGLARRLRPVALRSLKGAPIPRSTAAVTALHSNAIISFNGPLGLSGANQAAAGVVGQTLELSCVNLGDSSPEVIPSATLNVSGIVAHNKTLHALD